LILLENIDIIRETYVPSSNLQYFYGDDKMQERAYGLLRSMLGPGAQFREGQWEAISNVLQRKRTLLVQRTGWRKSIVYFLATKLLRDQGAGPAILISPLLSLMRNQIEMAARIGVRAVSINSSNEDEWPELLLQIRDDHCDILLVSPERLANTWFRTEVLTSLTQGIGLFVVDEAHCISDWGHDFRPDYRRIVGLLNSLPPNVPVLATTATANNRVVEDIRAQLGVDLEVLRGRLSRESLQIQVIHLDEQSQRLAWLGKHLSELPGTGIIYCLTVNDCRRVTKWLQGKGYEVQEYHADLSASERVEFEQLLLDNKVKALVATIALGMGFDKPDIGFVIHYQKPGSPVAYYQQIGRAGRNLENAAVILLCGNEDDDINEYFITSAFPNPRVQEKVLDVIEQSDGAGLYDITRLVNVSYKVATQCLKLLEVEGLIFKDRKYFRTANPRHFDSDRTQRITDLRWQKLADMNEFVSTDECLMQFVSQKLDDPLATVCGKCANCLGIPPYDTEVSQELVIEASSYLRRTYLDLSPRKQWPVGGVEGCRGRIPETHQNMDGKILSIYGDAGWGSLVRHDKYSSDGFREDLADAIVEVVINGLQPNPFPEWVTCVPSVRHPELVDSFAQRVAAKLGLPYKKVLRREVAALPQKNMHNSHSQAGNALRAYSIIDVCPSGAVLLLDDMVDSK
jgi:ATP-dependent DNA helicase RecQ